MKVVDIADELMNELGNPTTISLQSVSFWLRSNIGALSNYVNEDFTLNSTSLDIEKTVSGEKVSIDEDEPCYLGTGVIYYGTWFFCYESYFGGVEMSV